MGKKLSSLLFFLEIKTKLKWRGKVFPTINGAEAGGAIIAVSDRFMDAKFLEVLPGGVLSGVKGNWGKYKINVGLLYRPSNGGGVGSLSQKAKSIIGKELDLGIIEAIRGMSTQGNLLLGGDFNLDIHSTAKMLSKADLKNSLCEMDEVTPTFRRKTKDKIQESCIDHVAWSGTLLAGSQVTKDGRFVTDHIPIIGWVNAEMDCDKSVRKRFQWAPSFGSGDKKSAEKFTDTLQEMSEYMDIKGMDIPEIVKLATHTAAKIGKERARKANLGGWSPLSRLMELESGLLGTAIKTYGKMSYERLIPRYIKSALRDSRKIHLNDEEREWRDSNLTEPPENWTQWKLCYPTKILLMEAYQHLQSNLTEQRRRELRIIHGGRMRKMQEAADEGKIGRILKMITSKRPAFSLDCIRVGEKNVTDAEEITKQVTELFREWFFRSDKPGGITTSRTQ